jgi:two-component system copper resistance phosphate regulon response regulator CusR
LVTSGSGQIDSDAVDSHDSLSGISSGAAASWRGFSMRILVVGGGRVTGKYIARSLSEASLLADWVDEDDATGEHLAASGNYGLVVLASRCAAEKDWSFTRVGSNGLYASPVLLTASRDPHAHTLGANDCSIPPPNFAELLGKVQAILHSQSTQDRSVLVVADMELDLVRRKAMRQGKTTSLTSKEFSLLWLLTERTGEILPRSIIASQIWGVNFVSGTNFVEATIKRLRAKIDHNFHPKLIHTVRNMGYVLEDRDAGAATARRRRAVADS